MVASRPSVAIPICSQAPLAYCTLALLIPPVAAPAELIPTLTLVSPVLSACGLRGPRTPILQTPFLTAFQGNPRH